MSLAPSPSPGASAPSTMRTITVALCASSKKHQQSFDALRKAGELHNERALQLRRHSMAGRPGQSDASGDAGGTSTAAQQEGCVSSNSGNPCVSSYSRSGVVSRASLNTAMSSSTRSRGAAADPSSHSVLNCLFRFLNLNYDVQRNRMVVCVNHNVKGEHSSSAASNANTRTKGGQSSHLDEHTSADDKVSDAAEPSQGALADEVDVVLHKVATFGTSRAIRALERWCKFAQKRRSRQQRSPLVVIDPLEKVQLLMKRSMLYKLLDNMGDNGQPVALIPRTFMWDSPSGARSRRAGGTIGSSAATPLGIHSFTLMEKDARANGTAAERWWIAKPDEGTGPAFTHHLVIWLTRDADVTVPAAVKAALPPEACRFVLQEFYAYALPVVLKVYCVGSHINVKVNPTVNLLSYLWEQTHRSTAVDVPVMMDSQDKELFSAVTSVSTSRLQPSLSTTTSDADYGAQPATCPTMSTSKAGDAPPSPTERPQGPSNGSVSAEQSLISWESMIAPADKWNAFLAPGTPAHTAISKLAQDLSGYAGIGLSLYGFDILLVPQYLAHTYQRKGARGIGHTEGTTVRYDGVAPSRSKTALRSSCSHRTRTLSGAGAPVPPSPASQRFRASDMFDPASGAPTSLLLDSIPVVIDVNYFPGYKGIVEANQHMLELIAFKATHLQDGSSSMTWHTGTSAGTCAKKRRCSMM